MRNILSILIIVFVAFLIEFTIFNYINSQFVPNFMLICVVFFSLVVSLRHGLLAAFFAGLLKDSFVIHSDFEITYNVAFLVAVMSSNYFKRYLYTKDSSFSVLLIIFLSEIIYFLSVFISNKIQSDVGLIVSIKQILLPELIVTLVVSNFLFRKLKLCVSKLSEYQ